MDDSRLKNVAKMVSISREARSNQRRLLTEFGSIDNIPCILFVHKLTSSPFRIHSLRRVELSLL